MKIEKLFEISRVGFAQGRSVLICSFYRGTLDSEKKDRVNFAGLARSLKHDCELFISKLRKWAITIKPRNAKDLVNLPCIFATKAYIYNYPPLFSFPIELNGYSERSFEMHELETKNLIILFFYPRLIQDILWHAHGKMPVKKW